MADDPDDLNLDAVEVDPVGDRHPRLVEHQPTQHGRPTPLVLGADVVRSGDERAALGLKDRALLIWRQCADLAEGIGTV
ncbi:hypothetical protein ACIHFE_34375 [Streptomyces sp. NPDC052396]|uniref:hypothetical protein n=1 Tax=Streptomyces sp. NPDC052396 TaxID=3365689 RepID=UPI0037CED8A0